MQGYDHRQPFRHDAVTFKLSSKYTEADLAEWDEARAEDEANDVIALLEDLGE